MSIRIVSPSFSCAVVRTTVVTHHDRAICFDDLQLTHPSIVIAEDLQQHVAARAGGQQNIVSFQPARVIRNQIFRFGGLQLEPAAESASPPAKSLKSISLLL